MGGRGGGRGRLRGVGGREKWRMREKWRKGGRGRLWMRALSGRGEKWWREEQIRDWM